MVVNISKLITIGKYYYVSELESEEGETYSEKN